MFLSTRSWLIALVVVAAAVPVSAAGRPRVHGRHARTRHVHERPPTPAQIRRAVRRAKHSRNLWATINICNTRRHPRVLGIRGQLPALGFTALLTMQVQVRYWSYAENRFRTLPHSRYTISLGRRRRGLYQSGISFRLSPHAGMLAGVVRFAWVRGRRTLGHVTRWTSAHHPGAVGGDPRHYSAWKCVLS